MQVLTHLMQHTIEERQWMCLVAAPWWSYWCNYAALTEQDLERVPERLSLGLCKTQGLDHAFSDEPRLGAPGESAVSAPVGAGEGLRHIASANNDSTGIGHGADGENGNGRAHGASQTADDVGGAGKGRAVPTTLARRPHEIDNSSLQVRAVLEGQIDVPFSALLSSCCCCRACASCRNKCNSQVEYYAVSVPWANLFIALCPHEPLPLGEGCIARSVVCALFGLF